MIDLFGSIIDKFKFIFKSKKEGSPNQTIKIKEVSGNVNAENINKMEYKKDATSKRRR